MKPEVAAPLLVEAARAGAGGGVAGAAGAAGAAVGRASPPGVTPGVTSTGPGSEGALGVAEARAALEPSAPPRPPTPRRFRGSVVLADAGRPIPEFSKIAQEVISHLAGDPDVRVELRLEIEAEHRGAGFGTETVRTVRENARTLRFDHVEFEEE